MVESVLPSGQSLLYYDYFIIYAVLLKGLQGRGLYGDAIKTCNEALEWEKDRQELIETRRECMVKKGEAFYENMLVSMPAWS